ncbi:MAG: peptidase domain-containing ABC transporter [Treponema sp.]|nr:peptidase domain-containing ABC transporter [Treponema sp.]
MRYIQQLDETDCGAACLAIIASHYGRRLNIAEVRSKAGTDIIGTNINGLLIAAKNYGLKGTAVKGTSNAITPQIEVPFIVHWHVNRGDDNWVDHYVVVKKITKKIIEIWDPDPLYKKQRLTHKEFFENWTGYAIFFEPSVDFKKSEKKDNLLLKFIPVFMPHTKTLAFSFLSSILLLAFGIIASFYYKYIFDEVVYSKAAFSLHTLTAGILLVTIIQSLVGTIRSILLSHFSFKTDLQLNFSYLTHIFNLPLSFFESRKSGEVLSRLGDLDKIKQTLSSAALSGIMDVVMLIVSGPILFSINSKLFGISIATVALASVVSIVYAKIYRNYYAKSMSQNADVQSYLYESLNGVATVKALNAEEIVNTEYEKKKMTAVSTNWTLNRYGISQGLVSGLINGISGILVYWIGCSAIIGGTMSFGTLITFNSLLGYFTGPLFRLINIQNQVQEALVAAERVGEILELEKEKDSSIQYMKPAKIAGHIKFENVTFAYGSRHPVYEKLNLEIPAGSWTAFVGPSGSGKSTFVKLILKFYEPNEGRIILDGNDIRDIDISYLRSKIGYVPQDIFLFSGTIRENIALHNPDASLEDIIEAAKKAGADEFIEKLPKRYETVLGEHGGGLSGGEKQRLALARALLGNPTLIILDEATSSLDTVSEMEIHKVIRQLKNHKISVILIAHRLTTVTGCDKIFVMKDGKIVEHGNHIQLLNEHGLYSEMWNEAV